MAEQRRVTTFWIFLPLFSILVSISSCYPSINGYLHGNTLPQPALLQRPEPRSWFLIGTKFNRQTRSGNKFCGENLVNALQLVCGGVYKRSFPPKAEGKILATGSVEEWMDEDQLQNDSENDWTTDVNAIMKRSEVGVVDECCKKSCSVSTLRTYCGTKERRKRNSSDEI